MIVVAVDFSPISLNAVHYAKSLSMALDTNLLLFHAYGQTSMFSEIPVAAATLDELSTESKSRLNELKSALRHITSEKPTIYTESRFGSVVEGLVELSKLLIPKAVVMSTSGHGTLHDLFLGSNTLEAMRRIEVPLIVVPPGYSFHIPKKVGLASDMEEIIENTPISAIMELLSWFQSKLHILNIRPKSDVKSDNRDYESLLMASSFAGSNPEFHFQTGEDVPEAMSRFAEEENLDWIIVIPKKHGTIENLFSKSVSKAIAYKSHIPVVFLNA